MQQQVFARVGDPCPVCGGEMQPDALQSPERLIAAKENTSDRPDVVDRYRRLQTQKAERAGVPYKCVRCGYQARLKDEEGGRGQDKPAAGSGAPNGEELGGGDGSGSGEELGAGAGAGSRASGERSRRR